MTERVRLLAVDTPTVDRQSIRRAIEGSGVATELDEVTSAEAAIDALGSRDYDCLLIDDDQLELARELRGRGILVPIVLVTSPQNEEVLQTAVEAGVTDFVLRSDLSPRRLALRVRFAIRIGRAEAESSRSLQTANLAARARDDVLAVVSHDLRGPLHAISLACEALRD